MAPRRFFSNTHDLPPDNLCIVLSRQFSYTLIACTFKHSVVLGQNKENQGFVCRVLATIRRHPAGDISGAHGSWLASNLLATVEDRQRRDTANTNSTCRGLLSIGVELGEVHIRLGEVIGFEPRFCRKLRFDCGSYGNLFKDKASGDPTRD